MCIITKLNLIRKLLHTLFFALVLPCICYSQADQGQGPVARFTFNGKSEKDEVSGRSARLHDVIFREDRFGNPDHAVYLYGNENSYVSLGTDSVFKPKTGSFSLWFLMSSKVASGCGYQANPIILTKNTTGDDFYEAYGLNFSLKDNYLVVNCSQDSLKQVVIPSKQLINLDTWYHVVVAFDHFSVWLYINGELQGKQTKNFETKYVPEDSVLLGVTANKKNNRFFMGRIDDVEFYHKVLDKNDVLALYNAPDPNEGHIILRKVILAGVVLLILLAIYLIVRLFRIKRQRKRLELKNKLLETELKVNRALMNPHFVYNSLYSIQSLILNHDLEQANTYLVKFSRLLRKTLESNLSDTISLEAEVDLLSQFIEIENLKFNGTIQSKITTEGIASLAATYIPVLMIQPFVENAIWHGLKNKPDEKWIHITFKAIHKKLLECTVEDNGLGRRIKQKAIGVPENKSLATGFIEARLGLINKIYGLNCHLNITDKPEHGGTIVTIVIPILDKESGLKFDSV